MRNIALIVLALGLQGCSTAGFLGDGGFEDAAIVLLGVGMVTFLTALLEFEPGATRFIVFCIALTACSPTQAAPLDMARAGDTICRLESRHLNNPILAIGDGGQSRGECQISIDTALWILPYAIKREFVPTYVRNMAKDREAFKWFLHYPPVNRGLADAYLDKIKREHRVMTIWKLAYLWNAGINSDGTKADSWGFARQVAITYLGPPRASVKR